MVTKKPIKKDTFITIANIISSIASLFYLLIASFFAVLILVFENTSINDIIFISLFIFPCLFPLPLAINAHIYKRDIESIFHLGYMVFAPIIALFFYYGYIDNIKQDTSIFLLIMLIFILSLPYLFLLRNFYLWCRNVRLNKERKHKCIKGLVRILNTPDVTLSGIVGSTIGGIAGGIAGATVNGMVSDGISVIAGVIAGIVVALLGIAIIRLINVS